MTNQEKIEAIDNHFATWGDATNAMDGFIAWCWDVREETLRSLDRTGGIEQLADDIEYSVQQEDRYRGVELEAAAVEWINENTDDLIGALKGSKAN